MLTSNPGTKVINNSTVSNSSPKNYQYLLSQWLRLKELIVDVVVNWIPAVSFGVVLRRKLYRTILPELGHSFYIQDGAEIIGASKIKIGDNVSLQRDVRLNCGGQGSKIYIESGVALDRGVDISCSDQTSIEIGENTYINSYVCITGPGSIKIGKDCLIAPQSTIIASHHNFADSKQKIREQGAINKGIVIEDDCWLGQGVRVIDGVRIGKGSVIGAGAVVNKDIPPYSIAVGVPAKVIRQRQKDADIEFFESSNR